VPAVTIDRLNPLVADTHSKVKSQLQREQRKEQGSTKDRAERQSRGEADDGFKREEVAGRDLSSAGLRSCAAAFRSELRPGSMSSRQFDPNKAVDGGPTVLPTHIGDTS
jgi:hypothetical protein